MPRSSDRRYSCPVELTLDVVGGKWKPMILWLLRGPKRRFNDLQAAMPGITHKVLIHQLRELERDGIVTRTVTSEPACEWITRSPTSARRSGLSSMQWRAGRNVTSGGLARRLRRLRDVRGFDCRVSP
jgi:HxlR-like helix-turn-helix